MIRPFKAGRDHVQLAVRLTPNGGRDALDGIACDAAGATFLKARVSAVPEDGKANKALIALLAKQLRVGKSCLSILSGETARQKILRIEGEPEDLIEKLESLMNVCQGKVDTGFPEKTNEDKG